MLFSPEFIGGQGEVPAVTELLAEDLVEVKKRIAAFKERARQADRVVITIICCDSRVVFPENLVEIPTATDKTEKVLFIPVPTIGSGAPSRSRMRGILHEVIAHWGVAAEKVSILVTQHGDTHEVSVQHDETDHAISCGLRKVLLQNSEALNELGSKLLAWSYRYKAEHRDVTLAPDRLPLEVIRTEAPAVMALVDTIHETSGPEGARLPRRLIIRAAYRNHHSNLVLNEESVVAKIYEYLLADIEKPDFVHHAVGYAAYNHQSKELLLENQEARFTWPEHVSLPEVAPRTDTIQSPQYCLISFGTQTIPITVRQLLPQLCGVGSEKYQPPADNAFRTVASIPTVPTLLCALAESMYAVLHRLHPHHGDKNFADLQKVVILCDSSEYVEVVKQLMQNPEFQDEYLPALGALQPEGLLVVNLHISEPNNHAELETISY